jgi:hypothetical protein
MTFVEEIEKLFVTKGLSANSIKKYMIVLRQLGGENFTSLDFLRNVKKVDAAIKMTGGKPASDNTYCNKLVAIRSTIVTTGMDEDPIYDEYKALFEPVKARLNAMAKSGEKTDKEKEAWAQPAELRQVLATTKAKAFVDKNRENIVDYFLLSLYLCLPPRRVLDYSAMVIIRGVAPKVLATDKNYFIVAENRMVFYVHKNASHRGEEHMKTELHTEFTEAYGLYSTLLKPLPKGAKYTQTPLLQHTSGISYNQDKIRNTLYRLLGQGVGSSMLRKILSTEQMPDKDAAEKMVEMARDMGHTLTTHIKHYIKK